MFNHLVDWLSPTKLSFHVDCAIVSGDVCQVTWQVSTQVCYHVNALNGVVVLMNCGNHNFHNLTMCGPSSYLMAFLRST